MVSRMSTSELVQLGATESRRTRLRHLQQAGVATCESTSRIAMVGECRPSSVSSMSPRHQTFGHAGISNREFHARRAIWLGCSKCVPFIPADGDPGLAGRGSCRKCAAPRPR